MSQTLQFKQAHKVSFQQNIPIVNSSVVSVYAKYSNIEIPAQDLFTDEDDALFNKLNHSHVFVRFANLVVCIDMANIKSGEDHTLFVANDFQEPNEDDLSEFYRNQYSDEIKRIIATHDTKWIPYRPGTSQNPQPFDTDDHTISSMERI